MTKASAGTGWQKQLVGSAEAVGVVWCACLEARKGFVFFTPRSRTLRTGPSTPPSIRPCRCVEAVAAGCSRARALCLSGPVVERGA